MLIAKSAARDGVAKGMSQAQIEKIIQDRIDELRTLEKAEHMVRAKTSLQDKRDELENLLLKIRALASVSNSGRR